MSLLGWDVHFLLPKFPNEDVVDETSVHYVGTSVLAFLKDGRRVLKAIKPNYVHFLNPEAKASLASLFTIPRNCKVIGDWEDWHAISRDHGLKKYITRVCDSYMRRRADIVVTASRWLAEQFSENGTRSTHYIPYAVLPREFPDLPNPFQEPTAVFMGSFHKNWDHDMLIDAALILKQRGLTPPIFMIGRGADLQRCRSMCESHDLDNITFSGYLEWDDMLNRLTWAHVLLFPIRDKVSNKSRCPFKVFQYAQARRPILTSRVGEVPNFLGDKAHYVDDTPEAFADQLAVLMQEPELPNVDYGIEAQTWESRTDAFLKALNAQ